MNKKQTLYQPEGAKLHTKENEALVRSPEGLKAAYENKVILEGIATMCDNNQNLTVQLGTQKGIIPKKECALGIAEDMVPDIAIISKVGKPVSFLIEAIHGENILLSRAHAQKLAMEKYIAKLRPGMVIPAAISHLEPFGAFVDVANGINSFIPIENISISRIAHPADRFRPRESIYVVVTKFDQEEKRLYLSHKELLGTWAENAMKFSIGSTVTGIVRSIEEYGCFIEIAPNLSGLADLQEGIEVGDVVSVYIKNILPEKMKIKLVVIEKLETDKSFKIPLEYFISEGRLTRFQYTPAICQRKIVETIFE